VALTRLWFYRLATTGCAAHEQVKRDAYTARVPRWVAIGLGCVTALGMQSLLQLLAVGAGVDGWRATPYIALVLALAVGGYVAGHLAGRLHALNGAFAAALYVFVTVTVNAIREAPVARQFGLNALPPIDLLQLTVTDVLAMTAATWGGWLAGRSWE